MHRAAGWQRQSEPSNTAATAAHAAPETYRYAVTTLCDTTVRELARRVGAADHAAHTDTGDRTLACRAQRTSSHCACTRWSLDTPRSRSSARASASAAGQAPASGRAPAAGRAPIATSTHAIETSAHAADERLPDWQCTTRHRDNTNNNDNSNNNHNNNNDNNNNDSSDSALTQRTSRRHHPVRAVDGDFKVGERHGH